MLPQLPCVAGGKKSKHFHYFLTDSIATFNVIRRRRPASSTKELCNRRLSHLNGVCVETCLEGNAAVENWLKTQKDINLWVLFVLCVVGWRYKHIVAKGRWITFLQLHISISLLLSSVSTHFSLRLSFGLYTNQAYSHLNDWLSDPIKCNCSIVFVSITLLGIYIH